MTPTPEALGKAYDIRSMYCAHKGSLDPQNHCSECLNDGLTTDIALALTEQARKIEGLRAAVDGMHFHHKSLEPRCRRCAAALDTLLTAAGRAPREGESHV